MSKLDSESPETKAFVDELAEWTAIFLGMSETEGRPLTMEGYVAFLLACQTASKGAAFAAVKALLGPDARAIDVYRHMMVEHLASQGEPIAVALTPDQAIELLTALLGEPEEYV